MRKNTTESPHKCGETGGFGGATKPEIPEGNRCAATASERRKDALQKQKLGDVKADEPEDIEAT